VAFQLDEETEAQLPNQSREVYNTDVFWRDTLPSTTLGQATQEEAAQNINF
jgi:hypothetical protein